MVVRPLESGKSALAIGYLRKRIASGEWPINSRIPKEPELMASIGVGKSTLREAVRSLASVGVLETMRGIGTFVRSRTPVDAVVTTYIADRPTADILGYRRALEIEAARQAALHRTPDQLEALRALVHSGPLVATPSAPTVVYGQTPGNFHHLVFEAAGNPLLRDLYLGALAAIREKNAQGDIVRTDGPSRRGDEHIAIFTAIELRDAPLAASAMARHVDEDIATGRAPDPSVPVPRGRATQLRLSDGTVRG